MKQIVVNHKQWPYTIDKYGTCISEYTGKSVSYFINSSGYPQLTLFDKGIVCKPLLHRVIYETFIGPIPQGYEVHHKDENPLNFLLDNLELLNKQEHTRQHTTRNYYSTCVLCGSSKPRNPNMRCPTCQTSKQPELLLNFQQIVDLYHEYGSWVKQAEQVGLSDNGLRKRFVKVGGNPKEIKSCAPSPTS